jgi:hypothetical protein
MVSLGTVSVICPEHIAWQKRPMVKKNKGITIAFLNTTGFVIFQK